MMAERWAFLPWGIAATSVSTDLLVQDITSLSHHVHTDASAAPRQQMTGTFTVELLSLADIMQRLGHAGVVACRLTKPLCCR